MNRASLAQLISTFFHERGRKWSIGGQQRFPWEDEIEATLDKMNERLNNEPRYTSIELGGILLKDNEYGRGVYLYLGDLDDSS